MGSRNVTPYRRGNEALWKSLSPIRKEGRIIWFAHDLFVSFIFFVCSIFFSVFIWVTCLSTFKFLWENTRAVSSAKRKKITIYQKIYNLLKRTRPTHPCPILSKRLVFSKWNGEFRSLWSDWSKWTTHGLLEVISYHNFSAQYLKKCHKISRRGTWGVELNSFSKRYQKPVDP